jgi:hypothetical protein
MLALFSLAKPILAPNHGSHFSFIDLVIVVATPTNSGSTLGPHFACLCGSYVLQILINNNSMPSTVLGFEATIPSYKYMTLFL